MTMTQQTPNNFVNTPYVTARYPRPPLVWVNDKLQAECFEGTMEEAQRSRAQTVNRVGIGLPVCQQANFKPKIRAAEAACCPRWRVPPPG